MAFPLVALAVVSDGLWALAAGVLALTAWAVVTADVAATPALDEEEIRTRIVPAADVGEGLT